MTKRSKGSLTFQTRITAAAMSTAVSVLVIACALFTLEQWSADRARTVQMEKRVAQVLAPRLSEAVAAGNTRWMTEVLGDGMISTRLRSEVVTDPGGRVIAHYARGGTGAPQGRILSYDAPLSYGGKPLGVLHLHSSLETAGSFLPRYLALTGALFFAATAASLFLGRLLARRVIEPVGRLSGAMGEVAISGDLSRRVAPSDDDEFGRLIGSFNTLLDRLQLNDLELRHTMGALVVARDQAEAANVQKSQFLANMSHEIRTPLNGVLAMAQIMALGDLGKEQRDRLDVIRNSGEALLTILNDILDFSKIEAGALELEIVEFDLESLVRGALGSFTAIADGKGLGLNVDIQPEALGRRVGDPARLRQILSNLLSNALKFTQHGSVDVKVEGLGEMGSDGLRITVGDTGIGMPTDKLSMLFQKFTQLDASTTRRFGGTGLGLSICQELTLKMGGSIWAESAEGQGSTFYVDLPLPRAATLEEDDDVALEDGEQDRPLRILAAEDNPTNQLVLSTILEIFGADLHMVDNGRLAVEAWQTGDYDIILMDIQMPEMDGITAAREIRKAEAETGRARTPIVAVSANAMSHQVEEYLAVGMDGHVPKPIELNKLHAALEKALVVREEAQRASATQAA